MIVEHTFFHVEDGDEFVMSIEEPHICPLCGFGTRPHTLHGAAFTNYSTKQAQLVVTYVCTACFKPFFAYYNGNTPEVQLLAPTAPAQHSFSSRIHNVSPRFVSIYNQALASETYHLDEITGMGYRKALEFLIKDFLVLHCENNKETIENTELGKCVSTYVSNPQLKAVAQRSVWLGNDFTHYLRRFEEYDIEDLKRFIDATVAWIELELTTSEALSIVPRK